MDEIKQFCIKYDLPEIKLEGLTETEYNHRCKYIRLYERLIKRCQSMTKEELSVYCEVHHIKPKCLGGTNIKTNLVKMPVRYHLISHLVLINIYPNNKKLHYAVHRMFFNKKETVQSIVKKHISSRTIAHLKEDNIKNRSGKNHPLYGKPRSEETKRKLSLANKGRKVSEEVKQKISAAIKGRKLSKEHIEKLRKVNTGVVFTEERRKNISKALKGKPLKEETKRKMSESRSGEKHPMYGKHQSEETKQKISKANKGRKAPSGFESSSSKHVLSPDGTIYGSIKEAARRTGLGKDWIANRVTGRTKHNDGWRFISDEEIAFISI